MKQRFLWLYGSLFVLGLMGLSWLPMASATTMDSYNWTVPTRTPIPEPTTPPPPTQDPGPQPTHNPGPQPTATTDVPQQPTATPYIAPTATAGISSTLTPDTAPGAGTGTPLATPVPPTLAGTVVPTPVGGEIAASTVTPPAGDAAKSGDEALTATLGAGASADATPTPLPRGDATASPPPVALARENVTPDAMPAVIAGPANAMWLFVGGAVIFTLGALALGAWWKLRE